MKKILITESELIKLIQKAIGEADENKTPLTPNSRIAVDNTYEKRPKVISNNKMTPISTKGYFIYVVFPKYQPSMTGNEGPLTKAIGWFTRATLGGTDEKKWGATGHALSVVVDDNNCYLYEFGPYGEGGKGKLKDGLLGKPSTTNKLDSLNRNDFVNIAQRARNFSVGNSSNLKAEVAVFRLPDPAAANNFAYKNKNTDYTGWDFKTGANSQGDQNLNANCGTFSLDILKAGGGDYVPSSCSPFPMQNFNSIKNKALMTFTI